MTTIGVIIHRPLARALFSSDDRARLERLGTVRWTVADEPLTREQATELLHDAQVAIGSWKAPPPEIIP